VAHKTAYLEKKFLNRSLRKLLTAVSGSNASTSNILVASSTGFDPGDLVKMTTAGTYHLVTAIPDGTHVTIAPAMGSAPTTGNMEAWGYSPGADNATPQVFIGLFTAAPTDAGGGTEATGGSYARVAVNRDDAQWAAPSGTPSGTSNSNPVTFPTSTGAWSAGANMTHFGVFDKLTSGNLIGWNSLTTPQAVGASGITPSFAAGALTWTED
jgi:hypothetical protein